MSVVVSRSCIQYHQLHPCLSCDGKRISLVVTGLEATAQVSRCGMGDTVCERRDRMGTTGQGMGRETVAKGAGSATINDRDGTKTPYRTVDGGNRNRGRERSGIRRRERNITRFPVPVSSSSRPAPFPFRPHFPLPTFTAYTP